MSDDTPLTTDSPAGFKAVHAQKRAEQMKSLTADLRSVASVLLGRQEETLVRRRQVEGWTREPEREQERNHGREHMRGREKPH